MPNWDWRPRVAPSVTPPFEPKTNRGGQSSTWLTFNESWRLSIQREDVFTFHTKERLTTSNGPVVVCDRMRNTLAASVEANTLVDGFSRAGKMPFKRAREID